MHRKETTSTNKKMPLAELGMIVTANYVGRLDDGEVVDSTFGGPPAEFVVGSGKTFKGFEEAILGMLPGESKTVRLPPEDCYGLREEELVISIPKSELPRKIRLQVGQLVDVAAEGQPALTARVLAINNSSITLDTNHPLAGKAITYEIAVLEVTPP